MSECNKVKNLGRWQKHICDSLRHSSHFRHSGHLDDHLKPQSNQLWFSVPQISSKLRAIKVALVGCYANECLVTRSISRMWYWAIKTSDIANDYIRWKRSLLKTDKLDTLSTGQCVLYTVYIVYGWSVYVTEAGDPHGINFPGNPLCENHIKIDKISALKAKSLPQQRDFLHPKKILLGE